MAEQIKVGVVLEFQGLKGVQDIPKNVKSLLTTIQSNVDSINSSITFDASSLTSFAAKIQELNSVIAELKQLASKPIQVSIDLSGQSITAAAAGFADAFVEALTKARIPKGFASKMAASVAAATAEGGARAEGGASAPPGASSAPRASRRKAAEPQGPSIIESAIPDPEILQRAARDAATKARILGESGRDFMREMIDSVETTRKEFARAVGRDVSVVNQNAIQAVNKEIEGSLKSVQFQSAKNVKKGIELTESKRIEVSGQSEKVQRMEADPAFSEKEIEAERRKLKILQNEYDISQNILKTAKQQNIEVEIQYNRTKDRNKLLERVGKLDRSMTDSRAELNTALKTNVDDSVKLMNQPVGNIIESQVRILDTYGQRLANFRREASRAMDGVTAQISISQNIMQDLDRQGGASLAIIQDPSTPQNVREAEIGKYNAMGDAYRQEEQNARKLMEVQDGIRLKIEEIGESAARFKSASNLFRTLARTAEEPLRVFEKTQRTSERLSLNFQSLGRTYIDLVDTVSAGGELVAGPVKLSEAQAVQAKQFIEAREKQIQDIQKNIQDQMTNIDVFTRQIDDARTRAATSPTLFATDPDDPENQTNIDQQAAELLDAQRQKAQTYIKELKQQLASLETIGEGQDFDNLRISVEQFESFDELSQRIGKVSDSVKSLGKRSQDLARTGEMSPEELFGVGDNQLYFDTSMMDVAKKDFEKTVKEIENLRNEIQTLETAGFDTSKLRQKLIELDTQLLESRTGFEIFGKSVEKISETRKFSDRIENLNSSIFGLGDVLALSTNELSEFAREISSIEKEIGNLDQEIAQLEAEYKTLERSNDNAAAATKQAIDELKKLRDAAKQKVFGDDFARNQQIIQLAENLEKAEQGTIDLARSAARMTADIERASAQLTSLDPEEQLQGVNTFQRLGSEASSSVSQINDYIFSIKQAANASGGLTNEQKEQIARLEALRAQFESTSGQIRRGSAELDRVRRSAQRAGQGIELYSREVAGSVLESLKFVEAATIIGSVLGGLRTAFDETIESSKALARTMTVLQSTSMNMETIYANLKKTTTDTAIAYGKSVEDVAEIVKQFGSAGLTAEESFAALNSTMKTLISTNVEAESISRAIAGIYNVFGSELKEAGNDAKAFTKINDVLTSVYRNHQVELDEMVQGLKFTANSGKLAGFSFQEISAYLSVLNDNLLKSGMAGRSLNAVFAQIAAKSNQMEESFGFKFDPNLSIAEQFVPILEHVNSQLASGKVTAEQLNTQFKFFDRQGAKGFQTLLTQIPQVKKALQEMKGETSGVSDELSAIVRNDFGAQFERARQALLALGKDFVEPLKPIITFVGGIIISVKELSDRFPGIAKGIGLVVGVGGALLLIVTSVKALFIVLTVLTDSLRRVTFGAAASAIELTRAGLAAQTSGGLAARASALWTTYRTALIGVQAGANGAATSISVLGRTASIGSGWIGLALTGITLLIPLFASFSDTVSEVDADIESLNGKMKQLDRDARSLDSFKKKIDEISEASKDTAVNHEVMGQRIRTAFDEAGDKAVNYGLIVGKTNEQIGRSIDDIVAKTREQIRVRELAEKAEKEKLVKEGREKYSSKVIAQISEADISGAVGELGQARRLAGPMGGYGQLFTGDVDKRLEEATKRYNEKIRDISNNLLVSASNAVDEGFYDSQLQAYDAAVASLEKSDLQPNVIAAVKEELNALKKSFSLLSIEIKKSEDNPDAFEGTIEALNNVSKEVKGLGSDFAIFQIMSKDVLSINDLLTDTENEVVKLASRLRNKNTWEWGSFSGAQISATANIDKFIFNRKSLNDVVKDFAKQAEDQLAKTDNKLNLRDRLRESYSSSFQSELEGSQGTLETVENIVNNIVADGLEDEFGNAAVKADELGKLVQIIANSTGVSNQEAKEYLATLLEQANAASKIVNIEKLRQRITETQLKNVTRQANAQSILNDVIKSGVEVGNARVDSEGKMKNLSEALTKAGEKDLGIQLARARGRERTLLLEKAASALSKVKNEEERNAAIDAYNEAEAARGSFNKAALDYKVAELERVSRTKIINKTIQEGSKLLRGQLSIATSQLSLTRETNQINIQLMRDTGKLISGNLKVSREAVNELLESFNELIEKQKELEEAFSEENQSIFKTLEAIDKLLSPDSAAAGLESKLGGALEKISGFENKLKALNKEDENYQSERIKLTEEYVAAISEALDVQKEFKDAQKAVYEAEKKSKDFTEQRLNLYKEMNDFLSGQSNTAQKMLQDALKRQFEAEKQLSEGSFFVKPANVVAQLAKAFGVSVTEVELKFEAFAERYSELVSKGQMTPLQGLGGDIDNATKAVKNLGTVNNDLTRSLETVRENQIAAARAGFENAIESGDLERAKEYFDEIKALNDQNKQADASGIVQIDKYVKGVQELAGLSQQMAGIQFKEEQELKLRLNVLNREEIDGVVEELRGKLQSLKVDLKDVVDPEYLQKALSGSAEAASAALRGDLEMVRNQALGESPLKKSMDILSGAMNDLKTAVERAGGQIPGYSTGGAIKGYATGGKINGPGTKKSDSIMAMLSRGEYVVQAEAVDYYGTSFLNSVNSKTLKRFNEGSEKDGIKIAASGNEEYLDLISVFPSFAQGSDSAPIVAAINDLTSKLDENISSSGGYTDIIAKANEAAKQAALKSLEKAILDDEIRKGQESGIYKATVAVGEALSSVGDAVSSSLENILNLSFVVENIEALDNYREKLSEIGKTFDGQMTEIEDALQKNQSSYFDYLNSLQDAEKERIQSLIDAEKEYQEELKTTKEVAEEAFNSLFTGLASSAQSGIGAIGGKLTEDYMKDFAAAKGFGANASALGKAGLAAGGTALASGAIGVVGDLVTLASQDPDDVSKFIDDFIEQLPQIAESLITNIVENIPKLVDALVEMMPVLFDTIANALPQLLITLANAIPELLVSFLTAIIDNLPQIIQGLVQALVIAIPKIVVALIAAAIQLFLKLPEILFSLWEGILDGLISLFTDGEFWLSIGKSIVDGFVGLFEGIGDFFGGIFHEGGVVKGGEDVPIIAQGGEGVLSRQGMLALGGVGALDKLNSGINPFLEDINRYHTGGVVGETMTKDAIITRQPSVSSSSVSTSNNISVNVTVNGSMDSRQIDQMTNKLVNEIDGKLSKKVQDRDSRLARSMANRK
jgi:TP901 family phage tail tape measure protein